ncbi:Uncharacterised protein [Vibrio cholerae]|nr:Uncharacterised protein [Vibrio cholerae]
MLLQERFPNKVTYTQTTEKTRNISNTQINSC